MNIKELIEKFKNRRLERLDMVKRAEIKIRHNQKSQGEKKIKQSNLVMKEIDNLDTEKRNPEDLANIASKLEDSKIIENSAVENVSKALFEKDDYTDEEAIAFFNGLSTDTKKRIISEYVRQNEIEMPRNIMSEMPVKELEVISEDKEESKMNEMVKEELVARDVKYLQKIYSNYDEKFRDIDIVEKLGKITTDNMDIEKLKFKIISKQIAKDYANFGSIMGVNVFCGIIAPDKMSEYDLPNLVQREYDKFIKNREKENLKKYDKDALNKMIEDEKVRAMEKEVKETENEDEDEDVYSLLEKIPFWLKTNKNDERKIFNIVRSIEKISKNSSPEVIEELTAFLKKINEFDNDKKLKIIRTCKSTVIEYKSKMVNNQTKKGNGKMINNDKTNTQNDEVR